MSEIKFTPGPWKSTFGIGKKRGVRSRAGFICFLTDVNHYSGQDERYENELIEWKANADLIAAAPEMYEALEAAMKILPLWQASTNPFDYDNPSEGSALVMMEEKFKQALAKARGENNQPTGANTEQ